MKAPRPTKRSGYWYLIRRIPAAVAHLDRRSSPVKISTNIAVADDPRGVRAQAAVAKLNAELTAYWADLLAGKDVAAHKRYQDARKLARMMGFDYRPAQELASSDIVEILRRVKLIDAAGKVEDEAAVDAALGGVHPPPIMLSTLLDEYQAQSRASLSGMSPDQLRKWANPKRRAINNLIAVIGDKPVTEVTRQDALDFRDWWQDRILNEGVDIGTANKDIGHLNKMMRVVCEAHRILITQPFAMLRIDGEKTGQRTPYTQKFVQERFLADGVFDDLNEEARRIIFLICETGLRLSEACNLTRETIVLDAPVPHVRVRPIGRKLKTDQSERDIPLVGVALMAMREQPDGFPRYRDKAPGLSALVNKALDARGLRPVDGQSLYSLRHCFEDRLTAVEAPEKLIASLMGHKYQRPRYGAGPSLEQKREWLERIAFKPPARV